MKVITKKPILVGNATEIMSGDNGEKTIGVLAPTTPKLTDPLATTLANPNSTTPSNQALASATRAERLKKGVEKARGLYEKGQESGLFSTLGNILGLNKKKQEPVPVVAAASEPENKDNTMKYVLIGGGVLALGVIVYLATRRSGNGK
jgi:hypothetical protein